MTHPQAGRRDEIFQKIMARVEIDRESGCWIWQGPCSGSGSGGGYGRVTISGQTMSVHKVMFTHFFGIIPGKKQIDHTCERRKCCNPYHLEMVTHKQNQKRKKK